MTKIEDQLRDAFEAQLTERPEMPDPAGAAITRAAAVRRRRTILGVTAVLAVIAMAAGIGFASVRDHESIPPAAGPGSGPPVDVIMRGTIYTTDGSQIRLPGVRGGIGLGQVVAVPEGWLYEMIPETVPRRTLHLVTLAGDHAKVVGADDWALSPDGTRIAWLDWDAGRLTAARIGEDGFRVTATTTVTLPEHVVPVLWQGKRLVLAKGCCGGDGPRDRFAMWDPADGKFVPSWSDETDTWPYGTTSDGKVYGILNDRCLVLMDPERRFKMDGSTWCSPMLSEAPVNLEGDRWMGFHDYHNESQDGPVSFVDVRAALSGGEPTVLTGCDHVGPEVVSAGRTSLLGRSHDGELIRCTVVDGKRVKREVLEIPEWLQGPAYWRLVRHVGT